MSVAASTTPATAMMAAPRRSRETLMPGCVPTFVTRPSPTRPPADLGVRAVERRPAPVREAAADSPRRRASLPGPGAERAILQFRLPAGPLATPGPGGGRSPSPARRLRSDAAAPDTSETPLPLSTAFAYLASPFSVTRPGPWAARAARVTSATRRRAPAIKTDGQAGTVSPRPRQHGEGGHGPRPVAMPHDHHPHGPGWWGGR